MIKTQFGLSNIPAIKGVNGYPGTLLGNKENCHSSPKDKPKNQEARHKQFMEDYNNPKNNPHQQYDLVKEYGPYIRAYLKEKLERIIANGGILAENLSELLTHFTEKPYTIIKQAMEQFEENIGEGTLEMLKDSQSADGKSKATLENFLGVDYQGLQKYLETIEMSKQFFKCCEEVGFGEAKISLRETVRKMLEPGQLRR